MADEELDREIWIQDKMFNNFNLLISLNGCSDLWSYLDFYRTRLYEM